MTGARIAAVLLAALVITAASLALQIWRYGTPQLQSGLRVPAVALLSDAQGWTRFPRELLWTLAAAEAAPGLLAVINTELRVRRPGTEERLPVQLIDGDVAAWLADPGWRLACADPCLALNPAWLEADPARAAWVHAGRVEVDGIPHAVTVATQFRGLPGGAQIAGFLRADPGLPSVQRLWHAPFWRGILLGASPAELDAGLATAVDAARRQQAVPAGLRAVPRIDIDPQLEQSSREQRRWIAAGLYSFAAVLGASLLPIGLLTGLQSRRSVRIRLALGWRPWAVGGSTWRAPILALLPLSALGCVVASLLFPPLATALFGGAPSQVDVDWRALSLVPALVLLLVGCWVLTALPRRHDSLRPELVQVPTLLQSGLSAGLLAQSAALSISAVLLAQAGSDWWAARQPPDHFAVDRVWIQALRWEHPPDTTPWERLPSLQAQAARQGVQLAFATSTLPFYSTLLMTPQDLRVGDREVRATLSHVGEGYAELVGAPQPAAAGLVLSRCLAVQLGAQVGDAVLMRPPRETEWTAEALAAVVDDGHAQAGAERPGCRAGEHPVAYRDLRRLGADGVRLGLLVFTNRPWTPELEALVLDGLTIGNGRPYREGRAQSGRELLAEQSRDARIQALFAGGLLLIGAVNALVAIAAVLWVRLEQQFASLAIRRALGIDVRVLLWQWSRPILLALLAGVGLSALPAWLIVDHAGLTLAATATCALGFGMLTAGLALLGFRLRFEPQWASFLREAE